MKRKKLTRKEIEDVFYEYSETFNKVIGLESTLNEKEKLQFIRSFKIGYDIAQHYYFYRIDVTENDSLFIVAEKSLETLKKAERQYVVKGKHRKKRIK